MSRFAFAVVVLALLLPASAEAQTITVMTRNVFLGADLSPAIEAPGIPQAIDGAGTVWNELQSTKFAERVIPLAREIKASKADLVGLQEVALWRKQTPSDGGAPPISPIPGATAATTVELDFLALLRAQLGSSYQASSSCRRSSTPSCRSTPTRATPPAPARWPARARTSTRG